MKPSLQPAYQDAGSKAALEVRAIAPSPQTKPAEKVTMDFCGKCGAKAVRPVPPTLFHKFLSIQPHFCVQCSAHYVRFQFSALSLITLFALLSLAGTIRYFVLNPISFYRADVSRNTAESLAQARAAAGGLSKLMVRKSRTTMDNSAILKLCKAGVGSSVIVKMIHTSIPDYDIGANSIIELKHQGVDESVILAMIDATYSNR
jgi:hypothetical protein